MRSRGEHNERGNHAYALRGLAEIAAKFGPRRGREAGDFYLAAIAEGSALGMRPLVARCRAGLGVWYRGAGRISEAEQELRVAGEMLRSMGMTAAPLE